MCQGSHGYMVTSGLLAQLSLEEVPAQTFFEGERMNEREKQGSEHVSGGDHQASVPRLLGICPLSSGPQSTGRASCVAHIQPEPSVWNRDSQRTEQGPDGLNLLLPAPAPTPAAEDKTWTQAGSAA